MSSRRNRWWSEQYSVSLIILWRKASPAQKCGKASEASEKEKKGVKRVFAQSKGIKIKWSEKIKWNQNARFNWSVRDLGGVLGRLQEPHHQHLRLPHEQHAPDHLNPRRGESPSAGRAAIHHEPWLNGSAIEIQLIRALNFMLFAPLADKRALYYESSVSDDGEKIYFRPPSLHSVWFRIYRLVIKWIDAECRLCESR